MLSLIAPSHAASKQAVDAPVLLSSNVQTMPLLRAALHSDPNPIKGGGDITIVDDALLPEAGPDGTLAHVERGPRASDQISIYVVREGDTLSQIGTMFNVSVNTIRWANDLSRGASIQPGKTLIILPITGLRHTVAEGDTLQGIAKQYQGDLGEILSYNDLEENSTLAVGDVVVIPDGEVQAPAVASRPSAPTSKRVPATDDSGYFIHPLPGSVRTQGLHGYNAVDFGAPAGTPIIAAAPGDVLIARNAGWNGGYGKYIVIKHANGTQTLYAHNRQNIVFPGQSIVQGQIIGYVGATGRSTGNHLHFEVRGAANPF